MSDEQNTTQGAAPAAEIKPVRPKMPEQNGITRPKPETEIGQIWKTLDDLSATLKRPATRTEGREAVGTSANPATFATQYARWTKFYGVSQQLKDMRSAETTARREEADKAKAAKEAEKAEKAKALEDAAKAKEAAAAEKAAAAEAKAKEKADAKAAKEAEAAQKKADKEAERERKAAEKAAAKEAEKAARAAAAQQQASAA